MKQLNELFLLCREYSLTVSDLARITGIDRTRLHRLVHSDRLPHKITLREYGAITEHFPYFVITIK